MTVAKTKVKAEPVKAEPKYKMSLDISKLKFGELILFEKTAGEPLSKLVREVNVLDKDGRSVPDPDDPKHRPLKEIETSALAFVTLVYIFLRREDPAITFEQVCDMDMDEVELELAVEDKSDEGENPTSGQTPPSSND